MTVNIIARIRTELPEKFGVPRQSGLVPQLRGTIVFEPAYRIQTPCGAGGFFPPVADLQFHQAVREGWSPTVRPPGWGQPAHGRVCHPVSLSAQCHWPVLCEAGGVRQEEKLGPVLDVSGADLVDGTPILDIKPYLPYADCRPEATGGFTDPLDGQTLQVACEEALLAGLNEEQRLPNGRAGLRPPAPVSGGPGAGLWPGLCRKKREVYCAERGTHRPGGGGLMPCGAMPAPSRPTPRFV